MLTSNEDAMRRSSKPRPLEVKSEAPQDFRADLEALIPPLRAFARSLCGNLTLADDLVQEALTKAWKCRASYTLGTNLKAWLFMILRNEFFTGHRRAWRHVPWDQEAAERRHVDESQSLTLELSDTVRALRQLHPAYREALILVAAGGFSYGEAAEICQCAVGTVKSRVFRARRHLAALLDGTESFPSQLPRECDGMQELISELEVITSRIPSRHGVSAPGPAVSPPI